eukprot:TRINITY_DN7878_c0_g1_i2.p2 TRINITY_DN7878_c0_g1~~TRINITY_DN7878_c0_g1_i2.p2  ORF type:complete len:131 (+),score=14.39 TRINITY_DN7878_c0_g1_i2:87-479(+)
MVKYVAELQAAVEKSASALYCSRRGFGTRLPVLPGHCGVPHSLQNFAPGLSGAEQLRQPDAIGVPHSPQNLADVLCSGAPHFGQLEPGDAGAGAGAAAGLPRGGIGGAAWCSSAPETIRALAPVSGSATR